ncbi:MAG: HEPN domain-containing protein [Candidatus Diapherotrites archaeon]
MNQGLLKKIEKSREKADKSLVMAKRDLKAAEDNIAKKNLEWALAIAYNSVVQSSRALMFELGFIPAGESAHLAVVKFIQAYFAEDEDKGLLFLLDKLRRKRHTAVYDEPDIVSLGMAEQALSLAEKFNEKIEKELRLLRKNGKKS